MHAKTPTHSIYSFATFLAKASQERKLPHAHTLGIFSENHSPTQCGPCTVNIQGGMIFFFFSEVGGFSFVCIFHCPSPPQPPS